MKKIIKRMIVAGIMLMLLMSAEVLAADISSYGLSGQADKVTVYSDYIGVFSFGDSLVSSEDIKTMITSSTGWNIEGWSSEEGGGSEVSQDVCGGFLMLSKEGCETAYVPLKCSVSTRKIAPAGSTHSVIDGYAASLEAKQAYVIASGETALTSFSGIEFMQENKEYTYSFNIYADGEATLEFYFQKNSLGRCKLMDWSPDGSVNIYESSDNVTSKVLKSGSIERGRWHRIVLMYEIKRGRFHIYVDGVRWGDSFGGLWNPDKNYFYIGAGKGSKNGSVAFGNVSGFYGKVTENYSNISVSAKDSTVSISGYVISVDISSVKSVSDFLSRISTDASSVKVYKDSAYTEETDVITNTTVLVLSNSAGTVFNYYKLQPTRVEITDVSFSREAGVVYAGAKARYDTQNSKPLTPVLLIKDADGRVCKLITSEPVSVSATVADISVSAEILPAEIAELFFIDSWTSRKGYEYKIYKEAKQ